MIMPISTSGIGNVDISSGASKAKSKVEEKAMDAFASLMNMTAGVSNETPTDTTSELDTGNVADVSKTTDSTEYEVKDDTYKNEEVKQTDEPAKSNQAGENDKVSNISKDTNTEEEDIDTAAKVLTDLKNVIIEKLQITEEELDGLLESMSLELCDLLDVNVFKNFILTTQDATNVDLLINEDLSNMVNNLIKDLETILDTYNIEDVTEFISFVEENIVEVEKAMDIETEVEFADNMPKVTEETVELKEEVVVEKDYEKTVVKINDSTKTQDVPDEQLSNENNQSKGEGYQPQTNDTPENLVVNNLNQAVNNTFTANGLEAVPTYTTPVSEADIVRQIIDEIRVNITKDTTSMEVQLNPEHLGKVQINVASKDGIITAQIITENEAAKHAIENSIAVLKETFNNQELKVEAVEVMIASYEFFNQGQDAQFENEEQANASKASGNINLNDNFTEDELSDEEQLQVEVMRKQGSSVNYSI